MQISDSMYFTEEKLRKALESIEPYRYRDLIPIQEFWMGSDEENNVGERPSQVAYRSLWRQGELWSGRENYVWLNQTVEIPKNWKERKVVGIFQFGRISERYGEFEALLYVNQVPYQGVGTWHEEVIFPAGTAGRVRLDFRLWAGLEGDGKVRQQTHRFCQARIGWLDEAVDDFYYTFRAALETVQKLPKEDPERIFLLERLNEAYRALDLRTPGGEEFYRSIELAGKKLKEELDRRGSRSPVVIRALGHSHIDVAWLWRLAHTREKAARTFSTMLTLMEQYPEFVFLQSQPQLYQYLKQDYPDLYQRIRQAAAAGNWEANGGMWLEADCNIISGESLVRQLLLGKAFFERELQAKSNVLWLPDVFGYSWALPQILKKSGIDSFMTIKISWNQYNQMPHDTFWWSGIDGTRVLTHFMSTPDPSGRHGYTYSGMMDPASAMGAWELYREKDVCQELLLAYGYGDGGGGVNRDMLEMRRRLENMPGHPRVVPGSAGAYFEGLTEFVEGSGQELAVWDGELYLEYHRGTYTSQAAGKRFNRKLELKLREVEWLSVAAALIQKQWALYPAKELQQAWEILLRNQFHDILPGSSIKEVYEDSTEEYQKAEKILQTVEEKILSFLGTESGREGKAGVSGEGQKEYVLFNGSSFERRELVWIPARDGMEQGNWFEEGENCLKAVKTKEGWLVDPGKIGPGNVKNLYFRKISAPLEAGWGENEDTAVCREEAWTQELITSDYRFQWNEKGQLISLYDRSQKREVLASGEAGNRLVVYEDRPLNYDAWDIDLFYQEKPYEVDRLTEARVIRFGLATEVQMKWRYQSSRIFQTMRVREGSRRIDFETEVDWQEHQQLLRVLFPLNIRSHEAVFDIQFGNVKRPTHSNTSWDMAKFECVGHQWADLSETGYGVALMNDCKYGYSGKGHTLGLSLIKSGICPDANADLGRHLFTYSLYPHEGSWQEAGVHKEAFHLNSPLKVWEGKLQEAFPVVAVDVPYVMIDSVKKAEHADALILRLHEYTGRRGRAAVVTSFPVAAWQEVNLMEEPEGELQQGKMEFDIRPYEIKTFIVQIIQKTM